MPYDPKFEGEVYYGLHMVEGVCEYAEPESNGGKPYRILVGEDVLKDMDAGFAGKQIYVRHVTKETTAEQKQAQHAGWVVRSFFNKADGKHWCQFIVTTDAGRQALQNGLKLSNAYNPKKYGAGGRWHNVEYLKEVLEAEYDHLAFVPDPRYEESFILTPEEFKGYNSEKESELLLLANSKETSPMPNLNFFKRTKVDPSAAVDLESTVVTLKNGKDLSIAQIVNALEDMQTEKENAAVDMAKPQMANGDHKVKVGESEMTVNELVQKYNELTAPPKKSDEEMKANAEKEAADKKAAADAEMKKNADDAAAKKKAEEDESQKQNGLKHFETLRNAMDVQKKEAAFEGGDTQVARGIARYGS